MFAAARGVPFDDLLHPPPVITAPLDFPADPVTDDCDDECANPVVVPDIPDPFDVYADDEPCPQCGRSNPDKPGEYDDDLDDPADDDPDGDDDEHDDE